jgi:ketosteroid isomerase-like protein
MKRTLGITIIIFFASIAFGQENTTTQQINEQVWIPFMKSFGSGDDETFRSVHSKDIIRVMQDDHEIIGYDKYFKKVPDSIKAKWSDWKKNIELRFTQRIAGDDKAFEVGYYKSTSINVKTGEKRTGIGHFHVLLRKENGVWKILMDADTAEGASEANFNRASPM